MGRVWNFMMIHLNLECFLWNIWWVVGRSGQIENVTFWEILLNYFFDNTHSSLFSYLTCIRIQANQISGFFFFFFNNSSNSKLFSPIFLIYPVNFLLYFLFCYCFQFPRALFPHYAFILEIFHIFVCNIFFYISENISDDSSWISSKLSDVCFEGWRLSLNIW